MYNENILHAMASIPKSSLAYGAQMADHYVIAWTLTFV